MTLKQRESGPGARRSTTPRAVRFAAASGLGMPAPGGRTPSGLRRQLALDERTSDPRGQRQDSIYPPALSSATGCLVGALLTEYGRPAVRPARPYSIPLVTTRRSLTHANHCRAPGYEFGFPACGGCSSSVWWVFFQLVVGVGAAEPVGPGSNHGRCGGAPHNPRILSRAARSETPARAATCRERSL